MPRCPTAALCTRLGARLCGVMLPLLAGCAAEEPPEARGCAAPTPAPSTAALPDDIDLGAVGTITSVEPDRGVVNVRAVTEGTLEELDRSFSRALNEAGYTIVGTENEVVEADIFFANPQGGLGAVKFIRGGCEDRVNIELFIDR